MRSKLFILGLIAASSYLAPPGVAGESVPSNCSVTRPPDPGFEPPGTYNEELTGRFWLGTNALWTKLADDGIWRGIRSPRGTRNKFFWWREGWTYDTDRRANDPGLIVTARRIDGDAPVIRVADVTNAKLKNGWAMLLMLEIPTSGCWEITGNYGADSLSMVVWVPDKPLDEAQ